MMKGRKQLNEMEDKIVKGLEKANREMIKFKKYKKSPIVISRNGKVVEIMPEDG